MDNIAVMAVCSARRVLGESLHELGKCQKINK